MSFFRLSSIMISFVLLAGIIANNAQAKELLTKQNMLCNQEYKTVSVDNLVPMSKQNKHNDRVLNVNFTIIDSMANCYSSFYLLTNKCFIMDPLTGKLVIIKRGFYDLTRYPSYSGKNTKDNVFIIISDDLGKTWGEPILIYDRTSFGAGRYPSIYALQYEDEFALAYCGPLVEEGSGDWLGQFYGFWSEGYGAIALHDPDLTVSGEAYTWSTDSRILATLYENQFLYFSQHEITPVVATVSNANNIAYRRSLEFSDLEKVVPPQWTSSTFLDVTTAGSGRYNQTVGLRFGPNDKMYAAVYGNFNNGEPSRNRPAVNMSEDYGQSWSDFNTFPLSVIDAYAANWSLTSDSIAFDWGTKDFIVFDNGDFSYILKLTVFNYGERYFQIVEAYNEGGQWGIRKVGDVTGVIMTYADVLSTVDQTRQNPSDFELQASRTLDGKNIVVKWVDLIGYDPDANTFETTDIFVNTKAKSSSVWGEPKNITNDENIDRATYIPDLVPSDLKEIPIFKLYAFGGTAATERDKQFYAGEDQYMMFGSFDTEVGVEENNKFNNQLLGVFPNPTEDNTTIKFSTNGFGNCNIDLYDIMGRKLQEFDNGYISAGEHTYTINTSTLPVGTYYCNIRINSSVMTEIISVVR